MAGRTALRPAVVPVFSVQTVSDTATQRALEQGQDAVQDLQTGQRAARSSIDTHTAQIDVVRGQVAVNALDYGAAGDGVTDDTRAIQNALNAAEGAQTVVYLPRTDSGGLYIISDTLYVPNKVVLSGAGRTDAGLKAASTFSTDGRPMVRLGRTTDSLVFGCRVEAMQIHCNSVAKVGVFSSAANEQSGVKSCVVSNFTQYGVHFNAASIFSIEDVEILPQSGGATSGIYLQSCAGDNFIKRATIGVSGLLTNGIHIQSTQCIAIGIHLEDCTTGVNLDSSSAVLVGISGPTVTPNVTDLIVEQGNTRYNVGLNLVKNSATRIVTASFGGYTNADPFMPLWVGGDSIIGGATHLPRETTPAALAANANDYNPSGLSSMQVVMVSSTAPVNITGLVAGNKGRILWLYNGGGNNITLTNQDAASAAANRFIGRGLANTVLLPFTGVQLYYSGSLSRWLVMENP